MTPADPTQREWYSFDDDEGTWLFDVTFLTSPWTCIFGRGCKGVLTESAEQLGEGCCSYGAHFSSAAERRRVREAAERLESRQWQYKERLGRRSPITRSDDGTYVTRLIDDACVFLNRPGHAHPGCALHVGALDNGERPMAWKPDVCWQVPLRFDHAEDDTGHSTWTLREWKRRDWGEGGADFHWWCTDTHEAYTGTAMVYLSLREEIEALVGAARYERLRRHLDGRPRVRFLPHPSRR